MGVLLRIWAIFRVAAKRLLAQPGLTLAAAVGLITSVGLTLSIPLYADAVYYRILRQELSESVAADGTTVTRPPFAFMFRYIGAWHGPVQWEAAHQVDEYLSGPAGPGLGLPQRLLVRHFKTDTFQLFPEEDIAYADIKDPLTWASFAFVSDLEQHLILLEGRFPAVAAPTQDSMVDVLISEPAALELGLQVDETYIAFDRRRAQEGGRITQIPVRIAGIWKASESPDEFWFYNPRAFDSALFVPEETFRDRISPYLEGEVYIALWYLVMDGSDIHTDDVPSLLGQVTAVRQRAAALLQNVSLDVSPVEALEKYQRSAGLLTLLLFAFSVPIIGLILAFIALVVGLSVEKQRSEIAVLRSRGATVIQVAGIAVLEGLLLGAIALVIGWPVGELIARLIGQARSFLNFTAPPSTLRVEATLATLRFGAAAVGLALGAQVIPTLGAARQTVVTHKQERARALRPPWWQRAWIDVLLLIPAAYGAYVLRGQGGLAPTTGEAGVADPFQNPLLFLVPALAIFALTLFLVRLLPLAMALIAQIAARTNSVGLLLAAQHLSRTAGLYTAPEVLLVLTLSLSAFTASLAQTLDRHLDDQMYYRVGADMRLVEIGETTAQERTGGNFGGQGSAGSAGEGEPLRLFLPVSEHLKAPGVLAAARVGGYQARIHLSEGVQIGAYLGIDRIDFPHAAFWRRDFAPASLGALMNELAVAPEGALVSRSLMAQYALKVGDTLRVTVHPFGSDSPLDLKIVGGVDLFPTWYPEDGALIVGNLDYLFEQVGGQFPYDVWLKTDPDIQGSSRSLPAGGEALNFQQVVEGVRDLRLGVIGWDAARLKVLEEQQRPERQGLFGLLSVGFAAAAFLTVVGFLLYELFSFRRRFIELGVLRAVGLSSAQMTAFLAWELAFLILIGLAAGTGLGVWVSNLFIPYLQVGVEPSALIPPFVVEIAWPALMRIYALFGLLFIAALGVLGVLLRRMRIFQAIKLGETA